MIDAGIEVRTAAGARRVALASYLAAAAEEDAHEAAYRWIKALRSLPVDGAPFRERFMVRDDSLWWFSELYLHKAQVVLDVYRSIAALNALIDREAPLEIGALSGSPVVRYLVPLVAESRGIRGGRRVPASLWWRRLAALDLRARSLTLSALLTADRHRHPPARRSSAHIAAFVHRAFWRAGREDAAAESYIGPILEELERRIGTEAVAYVGIGRPTNFRMARRRMPAGAGSTVIPIERFASMAALRPSRAIWRARLGHFRLLTRSPMIRSAAVIEEIDCWPLLREQLAGIAWLQWPWSVRAMDEAAAALDVLQPAAVLTYAEAGGWGRALILEARRRGIPSAGLQHGFIYRHWLNYRHEPDEMEGAGTPGFPCPTRTLVFDAYAARHLRERGRFPSDAIQITGSSRLEELEGAVAALRQTEPAREREHGSAATAMVLITTKEKEARTALRPFLTAAAAVAGATLVIKPHPAETAGAYEWVARDYPDVRIVDPSTPLARLLVAARVVVTVNSTVALDAAVLDIPALVIGLPNNLSPFVDAGALAGSPDPAEVTALLGRILYDEGFRQQLAERRRAVLGHPSARGDGRAAAAAAEAVLALVPQGHS